MMAPKKSPVVDQSATMVCFSGPVCPLDGALVIPFTTVQPAPETPHSSNVPYKIRRIAGEPGGKLGNVGLQLLESDGVVAIAQHLHHQMPQ